MTTTTPSKSPVDTIREAGNDLITFLHEASDMAIIGPNPSDDWHRRKRQVIENWDAALSSLSAQPAQTMMSTDYEALRKHLNHRDHFALGIVGGEPVLLRMMPNGTTPIKGMMYRGILSAHKTAFMNECTRLGLEWVAPLPSQTEGLEEPDHICDLLMELHGEFYGKGKAHADAFRVIPKVVDFIKSRSLPRQKGEVVAWMKRDTTSDLLPESALDLAMEPDAAAHIRKTWMPLCEALPK